MRYFLGISLIILLSACANLGQYKGRTEQSGSSRSNQPNLSTETNLKFAFLNVGQGDATLITSAGETMLIDAGLPGKGQSVVLPYMQEHNIDKLEYIVATHYHEDHIGGIAEVIKGPDQILGTSDDIIPFNGILDHGGSYAGPIYDEYLEVTANLRRPTYAGERFNLGQATVAVLAAGGELSNGTQMSAHENFDENSASIVLLLEQDDFNYLHEADITGGGGDPPYETVDLETEIGYLAGDVDLLRVAHHGSKTSTNQEFINTVTPEIAILSVGDDNDYGHPHDEVIERLIEAGVDTYLTESGWLDNDYALEELIHVQNDTIEINLADDN
ncbi:MAG: MBL fold metallo-hydrolase [Pseudomonadota bacterium]